MRTAHSLWIVEVLGSVGALAWVYSGVPDEAHTYFVAELALLTVAFLSSLLLGGPGKVLLVGLALGFAFATLLAIGGSASGCGEDDFICFGPGELFAIGVIVAGALYPGWALGTGLGALARLENRRRQPHA